MARPALARLTASSRLPLLVAMPAIVTVIGWAGFLIAAAATGRHPIWNFEPASLAEAAVLRDSAAVVRRVAAGENLNARSDIREGFVASDATALTPIEAAALSGDVALVQLILDLGAAPDADTWRHAFCEAGAANIRELLAEHRPPGARDDCDAR